MTPVKILLPIFILITLLACHSDETRVPQNKRTIIIDSFACIYPYRDSSLPFVIDMDPVKLTITSLEVSEIEPLFPNYYTMIINGRLYNRLNGDTGSMQLFDTCRWLKTPVAPVVYKY